MRDYEGRTWRLAAGVPIEPGAPITARFVDGTMSGNVGGVRYRAAYDADGDRLRIGPLSYAAAVDDRGLGTLGGTVASARLDGDRLVLLDGSGAAVLTFEPGPDVDGRLVGRWVVSSLAVEDAVRGEGDRARSPSAAWIDVASDGAITGRSGVDVFEGRARTDGDRLYLGALRATRAAAPPDAGVAEAGVLDALARVTAFALEGEGLALRDEDGEVVARLRRA